MINFFTGIFSSTFYIGIFLSMFTFMAISALGNCISLRAGFFNLGGEGQIYLGGFLAVLFLRSFYFLPSVINLFFSLVLTGIICGAFSCLAALCNVLKKVDVLLSSYLFSASIIPVIDYFITVPFHNKNGNLLITEYIPENVRFNSIMQPSPLTAIIFVVPILCLLIWIVFNKTRYGLELSVWGKSKESAEFAGLNYKKVLYSTLFASGFLHGATGFFIVTCQYYTCHLGFATGLGWNALTCSLLALKNPLLVIPSGLFLSWIFTSASRYSLVNNLNFDISGMIQGAVIFFVAGNFALTKLIRKRK